MKNIEKSFKKHVGHNENLSNIHIISVPDRAENGTESKKRMFKSGINIPIVEKDERPNSL